MSLSINAAFDGGNIRVVAVDGDRVDLEIVAGATDRRGDERELGGEIVEFAADAGEPHDVPSLRGPRTEPFTCTVGGGCDRCDELRVTVACPLPDDSSSQTHRSFVLEAAVPSRTVGEPGGARDGTVGE